MAGLHRPWDKLYQDYREYWAVGGTLTVFLFGVEADLHPVQLLDAVLGFLLIDVARDDHATTRRLRLGGAEFLMLEELDEIGRRGLWEGVPAGG